MKTYATQNRKGGVSKTTTSLGLLDGLHRLGNRVVLIDCDPQCSASLITGCANKNSKNICDALTGLDIRKCISKCSYGDIVPASKKLEALELQMQGRQLTVLRDVLDDLRKDYDYCIIDCPPNLPRLPVAAAIAADEVIVPVLADMLSLHGLERMVADVDAARVYNKSVRIAGILLTMFDARPLVTRKMREVAEQVAKEMGTKVFNTVIRRGKDIPEAYLFNEGPISYNPQSNPAKDYMAFIEELLNE